MSVSILSRRLRLVLAMAAHRLVGREGGRWAVGGAVVRRFALASLCLTFCASALAAETANPEITPHTDTSKPAEAFKLEATAKPPKATDFRVGLRGGFSSTDFGHKFVLGEAFAYRDLPWGWDLGRKWHIQLRMQLTAGILEGYDDVAFDTTFGPEVVLSRGTFPITLDAGTSPTLLSRHTFGERDLGTAVQFTTHFGLEWHVCPHWGINYRFQHMSNAGLSKDNPGLNSHLFGVVYHF